MMHPLLVEELITVVSSLDRNGLLFQFRHYRANFPLDFSDEFLEQQSLERLRHIFLAVCLQSQRLPEFPAAAAA